MKNKLLFSTALLNSAVCLAQNRPNIILILSDDQGWGATSVQIDNTVPQSASDFMQTPNLERLAAMGMRFANGYTCHPNSSPSRAALITGKTPARLGITDIVDRPGGDKGPSFKLIEPKNIQQLPNGQTTIAQLIKQYRPEYGTALFGKWHLAANGPGAHGYDASDGATGNGQGNLKLPNDPKQIFGVTDRSIAWIDQQVSADKPFFIEIAHYATHESNESLAATFQKYQQLPKGTRHNNVGYAAMTEDLDTGIGKILDEVERLGIKDNTYIIYLGDNGSIPGMNPGNTNGPIRGNKATVWEGGIRTPFIIAGPGIAPNTVSRVRIVGWDLFPTFCEILGITQLPKDLDGGSILSVLKNGGVGTVTRPNDNIMVWHWPRYVKDKGGYPSTALIKDNFKYIYTYEDNSELLFDIENDIAETTPLNDSNPEKLAELRTLMFNYLTAVNAGMPVPNPNYSEGTDIPGDLLFHFSFEDDLDDETGQMTIAANNAPSLTADGKYGQGIELNGTSQWLDVISGNYINPDISKTPFTFCGWIYCTIKPAVNNNRVIFTQTGDGARIIVDKYQQAAGPSLSTFVGGSRKNSTTTNFKDNEWMHVAVVGDYSKKTITFYINGEQDGSVLSTGAFESCVGDYRIGAHKDNNKYFGGKMDELYFFQHALTKDEIVKVMNNQWDISSGLKSPPPVPDIKVYPNPANNRLSVQGIDNITALSLFGLDGRLLTKEINSQTIDVSQIKAGNYILRIDSNKNNPVYEKVIIE